MLIPRLLRIELWLFGRLGGRVFFEGKDAFGPVDGRCGSRSVMGEGGVQEVALVEFREVDLLVFGPG